MRHATDRAAVTAIAAKVRQTVLLDLVMPNVIVMRYCTGEQMSGFGSAYQAIAVKVGAENLVGEVLLEAEVRALLQATATV
jgi:hypothetical protein